jgi:hypothetical protein
MTAARAARRPPVSLFLFAAVCYTGVILFWRGYGERLWYPIQPQLYLAFGLGLLAVLAATARVFQRLAGFALPARVQFAALAVLLGAWLLLAVYRDLTLRTSYEMWGDMRRRSDALAAYLPPGSVVSSDWPAYDYLYSGLQMVELPKAGTADELFASLQAQQVNYLVIAVDDSFTQLGNARRSYLVRDAAPFLDELVRRGALDRVYSNSYPLQILIVHAER